jgi:dipeptidyl aminopeptidase/acylaminoacyl peptidase
VLALCLVAATCRAPPPVPASSPPRDPAAPAPPPPSPAADPSLAPKVAIQTEPYEAARRSFHTTLLRRVASPQPSTPCHPPAGATEIRFQSGELELEAWVNEPADAATKRPALLFLHGGFTFGSDDWESAAPFRDAGFVVLAPILRGENGQAGDFTLFYDEVDDVLAAADWLIDRDYVDSSRLFIAGSSAGGTLALLASMLTDEFRAVATFSASPDQALLVSHAQIALPFDVKDERELAMRSPLAFAASFKAPVRMYFGASDHFVQVTRRTAEVAKAHGLDVEAIALDGDHDSSVAPAIRRAVAWFLSQ